MLDDITKTRVQKVGRKLKGTILRLLDRRRVYFSSLTDQPGARRLAEFTEVFYGGILRIPDVFVGTVIASSTETHTRQQHVPEMDCVTHMTSMDRGSTTERRLIVAEITTRCQPQPPVGTLPVPILRKSHQPLCQVLSHKTFRRALIPMMDPLQYLDHRTKPFWIKDENGVLTAKYWADGIVFTHKLYYGNLEHIFTNYITMEKAND